MRVLRVFNRQKSRPLSGALLRRIGAHLLEKLLARREYELGVHLIDAFEMAELNETFLNHAGSTDVITFDHSLLTGGRRLHGEIFISVPDAVKQAGDFRTTWQEETVRYLTHGLLHLEGYDDLESAARRAMKREENKLVKELSRRFDLGKLDQERCR